MKKVLLLVAVFVLCSCGSKWETDQSVRSLSGSVASIYQYLAAGSIDGNTIELPVSNDSPSCCFIVIGQSTNESIILTIGGNPQYPIYDDIITLRTSEISLKGTPGSVLFEDEVGLSITYKGRDVPVETRASIKGWITNLTLQEIWTKSSLAKFELVGELTLKWNDPAAPSIGHVLYIDKIYRTPNYR